MPCEGCNGRCCKKFVVFITAFDAARIANAIPQLEPTFFLNPYPAEINSNFPVFKLGEKNYILGLDSRNGSTKECRFLVDAGNMGICGIYENRPLPCRTYPFYVENGKLNTVEEMACPRQWWPEGRERKEFTDNIEQLNKELEEYGKIVEIWNKEHSRNGSFAGYLDFALGEAQNRGNLGGSSGIRKLSSAIWNKLNLK